MTDIKKAKQLINKVISLGIYDDAKALLEEALTLLDDPTVSLNDKVNEMYRNGEK